MKRYILIYGVGSGLVENVPGAVLKMFGGQSACALCNLTFGVVFEKKQWKRFRKTLGDRIVVYHNDEIPDRVAEYLAMNKVALPVVLEEDGEQLRVAASKEDLEACSGEESCLIELLKKRSQ